MIVPFASARIEGAMAAMAALSDRGGGSEERVSRVRAPRQSEASLTAELGAGVKSRVYRRFSHSPILAMRVDGAGHMVTNLVSAMRQSGVVFTDVHPDPPIAKVYGVPRPRLDDALVHLLDPLGLPYELVADLRDRARNDGIDGDLSIQTGDPRFGTLAGICLVD